MAIKVYAWIVEEKSFLAKGPDYNADTREVSLVAMDPTGFIKIDDNGDPALDKKGNQIILTPKPGELLVIRRGKLFQGEFDFKRTNVKGHTYPDLSRVVIATNKFICTGYEKEGPKQENIPYAVWGTFDCSKSRSMFTNDANYRLPRAHTIDVSHSIANFDALIGKIPNGIPSAPNNGAIRIIVQDKLVKPESLLNDKGLRESAIRFYDKYKDALNNSSIMIAGTSTGTIDFANLLAKSAEQQNDKNDNTDKSQEQKSKGKSPKQNATKYPIKTDSDMDVNDAVQKIKDSQIFGTYFLEQINANLEALKKLNVFSDQLNVIAILTKIVKGVFDDMNTTLKLPTPNDTQPVRYLPATDIRDIAQQTENLLNKYIKEANEKPKKQNDGTGNKTQDTDNKGKGKINTNPNQNNAQQEENKRTVWITDGVLKTLQKFGNKTINYIGLVNTVASKDIKAIKNQKHLYDPKNAGRAIEFFYKKNSGPRIYVSNIDNTHMLICVVGDKDRQDNDIDNVKKIAWAYNEMFSELKNVAPGTAHTELTVTRQRSVFTDTLYNFDTDETRKLLGIEDNTNQGKTSPTDITLDDVKHAESVAQQTDPFQPIAQKGNVPSASAPIQTQKTEDQGSDKTTTKGITISAQELANQLKVAGCDISKNFLVLLIRKFRALFQGYLEVQEEEKYKLKCEPKTRDIARFIRELAKYINDSSAITLKWGTCDQAAGMYYGNSNFNIPRGIIPSDLSVALLTKCIEIQENIDDYKDYVAISGGQYFLNMSKLPEFIEQNLPDFVRIPKGTPEPEQAKDTPSSASEQESQSDDELLTTNQLAEMLGLKNTQAIANAKHNHPEGLNPDWFVRQGTSTKLKRKHLNDFQQWFEGTKKRQAGRKTQESVADTNTSDSVEKPSAVTKTLVKWAKSFERPNSSQPIHPSLMYLVFNTLLQKSSFGGKTMAEAVGYSKETGYRQDEEKYTIVDNNAFRTFVITKIGQLSSIGFVTNEHDIRLSNLSRICEAAQQDPIAYGLNPKKMYFYETGYNGEQRAPEHRYYFVRSNLEEFLSLCYTPNDNALRPEFLHDLANRIGKPITVISAFIDHYKDNEFIKRFAKKHPLTGQLYYFASEVEEFRKFFDEHYNLEYSAQQRVNKAQQKQLEKAQELEQCQKELDEAQWQVEYYEKEERSLNEKIQDIDEQSASIKTQIAGESTDFAKIKEFAEAGIELNKKREELVKARNKVNKKLTEARETYNEKETIYNTKKTKFERGQKEVSTLTEALEARKAAEQALKQADEKLNKLLLEEHDSDGK